MGSKEEEKGDAASFNVSQHHKNTQKAGEGGARGVQIEQWLWFSSQIHGKFSFAPAGSMNPDPSAPPQWPRKGHVPQPRRLPPPPPLRALLFLLPLTQAERRSKSLKAKSQIWL